MNKTHETYTVHYSYKNVDGYWRKDKVDIEYYSTDKNLKNNHEKVAQIFMQGKNPNLFEINKVVYH